MKNKETLNYRKYLCTTLFAGALLFGALPVFASKAQAEGSGNAKTIKEAFVEGNFDVAWRYRFGHIEQDAKASDSNASTLRTLVTYETKPFHDLNGLVQVRDVSRVLSGEYNDTINNQPTRPGEPDPDALEIDQLWIAYAGLPDTKAWIGRRKINLGNLRFISDLGWRQNQRSFDGVTIENDSIDDLHLHYTYASNVNRAFTDDSPKGNFDDADIHIMNAVYSGWDLATITAYTYILGIEESSFAGASNLATNTYGTNFTGSRALSKSLKLLYMAEYAHQNDNSDNANNISLDYYRGELGGVYQGFTAKAGYEVLEGDGTLGFSVPLGLLHAYNGWADIFATTPADGLEDAYVNITYKTGPDSGKLLQNTKFHAAYHNFQAENTSADYATEWDFMVAKKFTDKLSASVITALYNSDEFSSDTDKIWFILNYKL